MNPVNGFSAHKSLGQFKVIVALHVLLRESVSNTVIWSTLGALPQVNFIRDARLAGIHFWADPLLNSVRVADSPFPLKKCMNASESLLGNAPLNVNVN